MAALRRHWCRSLSRQELDEAQARTCMADDRNRNLIFMRAVQAGDKLGVTGTPTLFINVERYTGRTDDFDALSAALSAAN